MILAIVFWPIANNEVAQFIRDYAYCQLVNSCSHEAQKMIQTVESDTTFDVVFLYFSGPGDMPGLYYPVD